MATTDSKPCPFPKTHRLNRPEHYRHVFAKPKKVYAKGLTVLYRANGLPHARLGLAIAKKHAKLAVIRNRLRRSVRESFRHHARTMAGYDIVVLANRVVNPSDISVWLKELPVKWQLLEKQQKT